jgi:hypothetical protein
MGKEMFTCQNSSCRKSFTVPLKTLNLQQNPSETYPSCPFCLTKIEIINEPPKQEIKVEATPLQVEQPKTNKSTTKNKNNDKPPTNCHYHPGYLSERSSKENIPDDCLVCKDIVDCMLKKMRE